MKHDPDHAQRLSEANASLVQERTALKDYIMWLRKENVCIRKERLRMRLKMSLARTTLGRVEYHTLKHGDLINQAIEILRH